MEGERVVVGGAQPGLVLDSSLWSLTAGGTEEPNLRVAPSFPWDFCP